jgi:nucleotide-binding universal stress UspA family protein
MNGTANTPNVRELNQKRKLRTRSPRILIATDGSETSLAAYTAAELIAAELHARVHVLSVLEPLPTIMPPPGTPLIATGIDKSREDALRIDMVEQLLKLGKLAKWSTEIRIGKPASVIADVAKEREVDLVIVGASRHGVVDRILGEETATQLAKQIERPLLVASPLIARLPKRAVIALDLSPVDRSSFVTVIEMLGSPNSVSVLHVVPRAEALGVDWAEYDHEYRAEVESAFGKLNEQLTTLPHMQSDLVVMHGDAAREINQFAHSVKAELIVLGVKHRGAFSIAPGGGIAMKVVRAAECSVLLVPSRA